MPTIVVGCDHVPIFVLDGWARLNAPKAPEYSAHERPADSLNLMKRHADRNCSAIFFRIVRG
jgi:hypothetical protein